MTPKIKYLKRLLRPMTLNREYLMMLSNVNKT